MSMKLVIDVELRSNPHTKDYTRTLLFVDEIAMIEQVWADVPNHHPRHSEHMLDKVTLKSGKEINISPICWKKKLSLPGLKTVVEFENKYEGRGLWEERQ